MKLIIAIATLLGMGMVGSFDIKPANSSPKYCKVIAYVIYSKDKNYLPGQKICLGQVIPPFSQVTIACASKNNRFLVEADRQLKECETDSVFPTRALEKNYDRGNSEDNQLVLLSPDGRYLIKQKLIKFVWLPVVGARKYYIKVVDGATGSRQAEYMTDSNSFSIPFPKSNSSFSIIIKSFSDIHEINSAVYTFIVSPENTQQLITTYLINIDRMSILEQEKIQLKLSVFGEYNLINESLILLNDQVEKNPQDFESYLSLGDIQFFKGLFTEANKSYSISKKLAEKNHNQISATSASARIEFVRKYLLGNGLESYSR
jgi:hypothetical protein